MDPLPERIVFGRFELRPKAMRLCADGHPVPLGGRAFDLLLALVRRADRVVPRHELIDAVWPDRVVEENNLSVQINALRKALGTEYLHTVPGRGYRFLAPVQDGAAAASLPQAAAAPDAARTHLSAQQPLLIGRSEDLAALGTLMQQHRLVTLVGPGGIGKTRLAQALLHLQAGSYAQGVCWVSLAEVADAASLTGAVATALGVRPVDAQPQSLARALGSMQMLLALDNAEHLVDAVAHLVQTLLEAASKLRLLVTSQAPLRLGEERVMRLPPLAIPQAPLPALQAQAFGAVALFAERAQAAEGRFVLTDDQVPRVINLCRSLDGLPLAIELAAARVSLLGLGALVDALPARLKVLTGNRNRGAPSRQQTLRAAVQWSHDLLQPREQRLFRRLGAVVGSAPLSLVQAVGVDPADDGAAEPWDLLDALDELVQRSLAEVNLSVRGDGPGVSDLSDEPRYRLLESPRALAREALATSGEAAAVAERHARAVLLRLDGAHEAMESGRLGVQSWRRCVEDELDNAREALQHFQRVGDLRRQLRLASVLLVGFPVALQAERVALAEQVQALLAAESDHDVRRRAWLGVALAQQAARPAAACQAAGRALEEARALAAAAGGGALSEGCRWHLVQTLCAVAGVVVDEEHAARAQPLLDEALSLQDQQWPAVRLRVTARLRASIAAARGQAEAARAGYAEMLHLCRSAGDDSLVAMINLADIELWAGDLPAALAMSRQVVAALEGRRDEYQLAVARLVLAAAYLAGQEPDQARPLLALTCDAATRFERLSWWCDYGAQLAALQGRCEAAALLLGAADARYAAGREARQVNEARARDHVVALCTGALGAEALARLCERGGRLATEALAALVLAPS
jgi:predicted ATPase/DNA-binding winged helix-turn-helix (wHTH) protein